jgi:hypothetical protein
VESGVRHFGGGVGGVGWLVLWWWKVSDLVVGGSARTPGPGKNVREELLCWSKGVLGIVNVSVDELDRR